MSRLKELLEQQHRQITTTSHDVGSLRGGNTRFGKDTFFDTTTARRQSREITASAVLPRTHPSSSTLRENIPSPSVDSKSDVPVVMERKVNLMKTSTTPTKEEAERKSSLLSGVCRDRRLPPLPPDVVSKSEVVSDRNNSACSSSPPPPKLAPISDKVSPPPKLSSFTSENSSLLAEGPAEESFSRMGKSSATQTSREKRLRKTSSSGSNESDTSSGGILLRVPFEVWEHSFHWLSPIMVYRLYVSCKTFHRVIQQEQEVTDERALLRTRLSSFTSGRKYATWGDMLQRHPFGKRVLNSGKQQQAPMTAIVKPCQRIVTCRCPVWAEGGNQVTYGCRARLVEATRFHPDGTFTKMERRDLTSRSREWFFEHRDVFVGKYTCYEPFSLSKQFLSDALLLKQNCCPSSSSSSSSSSFVANLPISRDRKRFYQTLLDKWYSSDSKAVSFVVALYYRPQSWSPAIGLAPELPFRYVVEGQDNPQPVEEYIDFWQLDPRTSEPLFRPKDEISRSFIIKTWDFIQGRGGGIAKWCDHDNICGKGPGAEVLPPSRVEEQRKKTRAALSKDFQVLFDLNEKRKNEERQLRRKNKSYIPDDEDKAEPYLEFSHMDLGSNPKVLPKTQHFIEFRRGT